MLQYWESAQFCVFLCDVNNQLGCSVKLRLPRVICLLGDWFCCFIVVFVAVVIVLSLSTVNAPVFKIPI